ncbi:thioester-containing protein 1 allele R1-like [Chironomus tepperi]|uniref:thioester-containing protein 1 allele R1-like n=1 Tax=Chironomus tepperi TaxID=113505 RepID=UPI00391F962D
MYGDELNIKVGVQGLTNTGEVVEVFQDLTLNPGSSKVLKFEFPNISHGLYELVAETDDYSKSVGLYINPKKVTLMIQLDKPIYKTTDVVNFRIFAIDSRTKPYMKILGYSKIWILDTRNNELKSWENVQLTMGVYQNKFVFTRLQPGIYEILAEVEETIVSKKFEIFKDSQSIYDLRLTVPERISYRDGLLRFKISIHLRSKYAFDNFHSISGMLLLTCDAMSVVKYQRIVNASHYELYESIDFINDLGLDFMNDQRMYTLHAVFMDDVTKKNFTSTAAFTIEMSEFQIQIVHSPKYFKIGIPFSFTLLVTKSVDELPVMSSIEPIYVVVKNDNDDILIDQAFELDPNTGTVEIYTPEIPEGTLFLNILTQYDKIQYVQQVNLSSTQRSESIAIDVLTPRPKMYEQVDFVLTTTSKSTSFAVFQVLAKGLLKMSKVHLNVDSTDSISPGSTVSLNITSTLFSSVSLHAIDQRGISQRHKYDILKDYVFDNELIKYDRAAIENFYDFDIPFWFYPLSYQKTFFEVGAVILSNAVQNIPCKADDSGLSVYDKFVIDDELSLKASREDIEDVKMYYDGFLFQTVVLNASADEEGIKGQKFLLAELPEVSSTWAFTAITLNEEYGFGMTEDPFLLDSYKKFFIDFAVPAFVKVGEIFLLEILIGNLHDEDLTANVQVFDYRRGFQVSRPMTYGWNEAENGYHQTVEIPPFNVHRLVIEVSAETFGSYSIQIAATSVKGVESKVDTITIIPEGFLTTKTDSIVINRKDCNANTFKTLELNLDEDSIIDGTLAVHANIFGDIMGTALSNINAILKEPTESAEEILFAFSLNVLTLDYLLLTDQLTVSIKTSIEHYLTQSYQKLIRFRNMDGSFSSFISSSNQGSIWLTANVIRQLQKAQRYIDISPEVFLEALMFIASKQESDGKFISDRGAKQDNTVHSDVAFTAFIGILFDENEKSHPQYISVLQKAVEYVELNYDKSNLYSLALVTYFMYEVDSTLKYELLQSLLSHIQDISSNEVSWKDFNATSMDVEINSYCLMILNHIPELYAEAFKIVQWLLIHQNSNGKFFSTSDTIVALEAISRFASRLSDTRENLEMILAPNSDEDHAENVYINGPLKLVKQMYMLPPTTRHLDVSAHGDGFAIVQLSCSYYVYSIQSSDAISLMTQFKEESCSDYLILSVSIELELGELSDTIGISIESPSGFVYDDIGIELLDYLVNIEELNQGTLIHIYLKNFGRNIQFDLAFLRKFVIFNEAYSNIEVFDLNRDAMKTSTFYKAPEALPLCSNKTLTTSPPVYEFTTLEPLSTHFHHNKDLNHEFQSTDEFTTEGNISNFDDEIEPATENEEGLEDFDFLTDDGDSRTNDVVSPDLYTLKEIVPTEEVAFDSHDLPDENSVTFSDDSYYPDTPSYLKSTSDINELPEYSDTDDMERIIDLDDFETAPESNIFNSGNSGSGNSFLNKEIVPNDADYVENYSLTDELIGPQKKLITSELEDEYLKEQQDFLTTDESIVYEDAATLEFDYKLPTNDELETTEDELTNPEIEDEVFTVEPTTTTTVNPKKFLKRKNKPKALPKSFKTKHNQIKNRQFPKMPSKFKHFSKH